MGGGLLQLVAYGAQDVYLSGNPQITFFKVVYRRHTNFAMEAIQQTFSGIANYGNTVYCQISRNGDLIHRTYLEVDIPQIKTGTAVSSATSYVNYLGLRLLKNVSIEIGGQQIDKHYSDWLYIWNELSLPIGKRYAWDTMVGADANILNYADNTTTTPSTTKLFIPLEFWFCRNIGLALPLIALQYHEVKIKIEFESFLKCVFKTAAPAADGLADGDSAVDLVSPNLWVDYIYLDTDERRKFAQLSHEYLIEQLQFTGTETLNNSTTRVKLNFNHPCKELIWVAKLSGVPNNGWYNYTIPTLGAAISADNTTYGYTNGSTDGTSSFYPVKDALNNYKVTSNATALSDADIYKNLQLNIEPYDPANANINKNFVNPFYDALLQLNGNDRFAVRNGEYFNLVQPYQHHTNIPLNRGINVYSFAIKPEEHQPSGTLNMSRIDTAVLAVTPKSSGGTTYAGNINIYAVNYNVLRILSGMGGLAYSN
jgi:hypothetical protein